MMRTSVEGFEHRVGSHCASTALRDVLEFKGIRLTEAMVLGLGAAPWFILFENDRFTPTRFFHGRTVSFEHDLAGTLGLTFDERSAPYDEALVRLRELTSRGEPVLAVSDVRWLPYFATTSHFNGHRIVVTGFDGDDALVTDSHFPGVQRVDAGNFKASLTSDAPPYPKDDVVFGTLTVGRPPALATLVRPAIRRAAETMQDGSEQVGLGGLERLAATLGRWETQPDAKWACRFAYQVIERRGTGGGLFRRLYAAFLAESAESFRDPVARSLVVPATAAADRWSALAAEFKAQSEHDAPRLGLATRLASDVLAAESELWGVARERAS